MASDTRSRALRQAKLAADVSTSPQYSALRLLLRQAQSDYQSGVHQARGGALILRQAAKSAEPKMAGYFNTAGQSIARNLGSVGIDPHTVQGPAQADIADTLNRLATTQASAQGELTQRGVDAAAGANYQVQNLGNQRAASVQKIGSQLLDLAGQKGKLTESTYLTLLNQAAGRSVTRRGQTLSHLDRVAGQKETKSYHQAQIDIRRGIDPVTGKRLPKSGRAGTKAGKAETQSAVNLKRGIQNTLSQLNQGHSVHYLVSALKVPPDVLQAATDIHSYGALLPDTVRTLRMLGVKVPRGWLPNANTPGGGKPYQGPH